MDCRPQASLSMGLSRQEYWSGLPFPSSGDLSNPGTEPASPASPPLASRFATIELPGKPQLKNTFNKICVKLNKINTLRCFLKKQKHCECTVQYQHCRRHMKTSTSILTDVLKYCVSHLLNLF